MDKLDKLIADKQAEIDHLAKLIAEQTARQEKLAIQIETLKQAAELRPVVEFEKEPAAAPAESHHSNGAPADEPKRTGRQTGDIAKEWRDALRTIWLRGTTASYEDFHKAARSAGIDCEIPNVRGRVRHFASVGFVSGDPEKGFLVTENAAQRFGFRKRKAPAEENSVGASQ